MSWHRSWFLMLAYYTCILISLPLQRILKLLSQKLTMNPFNVWPPLGNGGILHFPQKWHKDCWKWHKFLILKKPTLFTSIIFSDKKGYYHQKVQIHKYNPRMKHSPLHRINLDLWRVSISSEQPVKSWHLRKKLNSGTWGFYQVTLFGHGVLECDALLGRIQTCELSHF